MKQEMMGLAVASGGPHANHLHLTSDVTMPAHHHSIFITAGMLFLMSNQQCQSTEGKIV